MCGQAHGVKSKADRLKHLVQEEKSFKGRFEKDEEDKGGITFQRQTKDKKGGALASIVLEAEAATSMSSETEKKRGSIWDAPQGALDDFIAMRREMKATPSGAKKKYVAAAMEDKGVNDTLKLLSSECAKDTLNFLKDEAGIGHLESSVQRHLTDALLKGFNEYGEQLLKASFQNFEHTLDKCDEAERNAEVLDMHLKKVQREYYSEVIMLREKIRSAEDQVDERWNPSTLEDDEIRKAMSARGSDDEILYDPMSHILDPVTKELVLLIVQERVRNALTGGFERGNNEAKGAAIANKRALEKLEKQLKEERELSKAANARAQAAEDETDELRKKNKELEDRIAELEGRPSSQPQHTAPGPSRRQAGMHLDQIVQFEDEIRRLQEELEEERSKRKLTEMQLSKVPKVRGAPDKQGIVATTDDPPDEKIEGTTMRSKGSKERKGKARQNPKDTADSESTPTDSERVRTVYSTHHAGASLEGGVGPSRDNSELERLRGQNEALQLVIDELRERIAKLEAILDKTGLGHKVKSALREAGLGALIVRGPPGLVFTRLYLDALQRLGRLEELRTRFWRLSEREFAKILGAVYDESFDIDDSFGELSGSTISFTNSQWSTSQEMSQAQGSWAVKIGIKQFFDDEIGAAFGKAEKPMQKSASNLRNPRQFNTTGWNSGLKGTAESSRKGPAAKHLKPSPGASLPSMSQWFTKSPSTPELHVGSTLQRPSSSGSVGASPQRPSTSGSVGASGSARRLL